MIFNALSIVGASTSTKDVKPSVGDLEQRTVVLPIVHHLLMWLLVFPRERCPELLLKR
jgi:hypothetical protein